VAHSSEKILPLLPLLVLLLCSAVETVKQLRYIHPVTRRVQGVVAENVKAVKQQCPLNPTPP
jgi:hypothetical protein